MPYSLAIPYFVSGGTSHTKSVSGTTTAFSVAVLAAAHLLIFTSLGIVATTA
jgi:hypothetical protein